MIKKNDPTRSELAAAFYEEIKGKESLLLPVALCTIGNVMVETNASSLNACTNATFSGKRYKVEATFTIKEIQNE